MTRSPFENKSQSTNSANKKPSSSLPLWQLIILAMVITLLAAIFVQNLQPTVQIIFFGQKILPIPLSVAMLVALVGGGLLALIFNAIANWRQNTAIRRALAVSGYSKNDPKEQVKASNPSINSPQKEKVQDFVEDDYEDEEYEDEDEFYEDEETDDEEEEDNDPDTVPYGDRKNLKSAKPNRDKRDRPPLEAKFINGSWMN
ncbi:LapA family protein [Pseudanabaena sp. FACHB-1998]|nr:LapA family protein [Pseudanabaena sp. FACHB-1998]